MSGRAAPGIWHGWPAWSLSNEQVSLVAVPELGGKVASVRTGSEGAELLFQPTEPYRSRQPGDLFADHDASGWDECFPSVLPEGVLPDHGEVWTLSFVAWAEADTLVLEAEGRVLPYRYRKTLRLDGPTIVCRAEITNQGPTPWAAVWTLHALFAWEDRLELVPPAGLQAPPLAAAGGDVKTWHQVPDGPVSCGLRFPGLGAALTLAWDGTDLPGLGLWMTNGGFRGDRNLAWEPSSAPFDRLSEAQAAGQAPLWRPGETKAYEYRVTWAAFESGVR